VGDKKEEMEEGPMERERGFWRLCPTYVPDMLLRGRGKKNAQAKKTVERLP